MQRRRLIQLGAVALLLASCSATSDFFLGKDNRPAPKPLPASSGQVATNILWKHNLGDGGADKGLALKPAYRHMTGAARSVTDAVRSTARRLSTHLLRS